MSTYEPGTVVVATVRGERNVRIFHTQGDWISGETVEGSYWHSDEDITDIRPLVVLDPADAVVVEFLKAHEKKGCSFGGAELARAISEQTKPARIPEPGLWGVVRDSHTGNRFMRESEDGGWRWFNIDTRSNQNVKWADLVDPVLVRAGIEDES